ncbi:IS30 family transposase [Flavobacterium sp. 7E]|nr:helix-turn-helix domain-containing protein [Flavobacterium sp. 7E]NRS89798.1 IS30 family transposase [Flavobacterium sp. 7E]
MSHLTIEQRYEIATLRSQGFSMSKIGGVIGRDKSVITAVSRSTLLWKN